MQTTTEIAPPIFGTCRYVPVRRGTKIPVPGWQSMGPRNKEYTALKYHAIYLNDDFIVIDFDRPVAIPYHRQPFRALRTVVVRTPRGGIHVWFRNDIPNIARTRLEILPGIDWLAGERICLIPTPVQTDYQVIVGGRIAPLSSVWMGTIEQTIERVTAQGAVDFL